MDTHRGAGGGAGAAGAAVGAGAVAAGATAAAAAPPPPGAGAQGEVIGGHAQPEAVRASARAERAAGAAALTGAGAFAAGSVASARAARAAAAQLQAGPGVAWRLSRRQAFALRWGLPQGFALEELQLELECVPAVSEVGTLPPSTAEAASTAGQGGSNGVGGDGAVERGKTTGGDGHRAARSGRRRAAAVKAAAAGRVKLSASERADAGGAGAEAPARRGARPKAKRERAAGGSGAKHERAAGAAARAPRVRLPAPVERYSAEQLRRHAEQIAEERPNGEGVSGVSKGAQSTWLVQIKWAGKGIHVGYFHALADAVERRLLAEKAVAQGKRPVPLCGGGYSSMQQLEHARKVADGEDPDPSALGPPSKRPRPSPRAAARRQGQPLRVASDELDAVREMLAMERAAAEVLRDALEAHKTKERRLRARLTTVLREAGEFRASGSDEGTKIQ